MVGRWPDRIGLYGILLFNLIICPFVCCDCWESCFVPSERNEFTVEYEKIFQVVTTFRQAMTTDANTGSGTSNGTVFLMDTTMPTGTDDSTGYFSYTIQKRLAQILAFTLPITSSFNPGFFVHYDGKHSWTCDDWKCLGRCDMYLALESEFQDYTTTDDIDLLDDSCELASLAATSSTCYGTTHNIFAIAVTNSAYKTRATEERGDLDDDESNFSLDLLTQFGGIEDTYFEMDDETPEFNSYCENHFLKKAILGTLQADSQSMGPFPSASTSYWPGYTRISNSLKMVDATNKLSRCLHSSCCSNRSKRSTMDPEINFFGNCAQFRNGKTMYYNGSNPFRV